MNIEVLREELQEEYPSLMSWEQGNFAELLEKAEVFADEGQTGNMEATIAKACVGRSDGINIDGVSRIRAHGYQVSIQDKISRMWESEDIYVEILHGRIAGALIVEHQKPSHDRRPNTVVEEQTSQFYLQEHIRDLSFLCDTVDREQTRLERIIRTYFPPDSEWWAELINSD